MKGLNKNEKLHKIKKRNDIDHFPQQPFFLVAGCLLSAKLKLTPLSKSIPEAKLGRTKLRKAPFEMNFLCIILAAFSNNLI